MDDVHVWCGDQSGCGSGLISAARTRSLVAELLQDGGSKLVAVDRLRQIVLKSRRAHAGISHAARDEGDGRHRPSEADVEMPKLGEEFAPGRLSRLEVTHDDIGDERSSNRVIGTGGGDERARDLEHRPKEVARELIVLDHQDVNPSKFRRRIVHRLLAWSALQDGLHVALVSIGRLPRRWRSMVSAKDKARQIRQIPEYADLTVSLS